MGDIMKRWSIALTGLLLAATLAGCGSQKVVATTNGGNITEPAYYSSLKETPSGQQVLQQMILSKVLEKQYGDKVSQTAVNQLFNQTKAQYGSSFNRVLSQGGITQSSYKSDIRFRLLFKEAVKANIKITDAQLKKQFKHYEPKVTVAHILVANKTTAQKIITQLSDTKPANREKTFTQLAKRYSTDTVTKNKGGKRAQFDSTDTTLDSAFKQAAFKLKTDDYTTVPVKTQYGYHVILMLNNPGKGTVKDHKAALTAQIVNQEVNNSEVTHEVIAKVLKKGDVSIKDSQLKQVLSDYMSSSSSNASSK